jgi:hypothetical protein
MSTPMVRKQVYLARSQHQKLKALAAYRGCTESELIREAVDQLPDPEGDLLERLVAAGVLVPRQARLEAPSGPALKALEAWFKRWLGDHPAGLRLSDAVLADREGR